MLELGRPACSRRSRARGGVDPQNGEKTYKRLDIEEGPWQESAFSLPHTMPVGGRDGDEGNR
eukprot:3988600-Pyramimonas_sp.AAC.1